MAADLDHLTTASERLARRADELGQLQARLRAQAEATRWTSPAATAFDHALAAMLVGIHTTRRQLLGLSEALSTHARTARRRAEVLDELAAAVEHPSRVVNAVASLL